LGTNRRMKKKGSKKSSSRDKSGKRRSRHDRGDDVEDRHRSPLGDESDEEETKEEYVVEDILDKKSTPDGPLYLVKWVGYGPEDNTWEPEENLVGCLDLLEKFNRSYEKPTSSSSKVNGSHKRKSRTEVALDLDEDVVEEEQVPRASSSSKPSKSESKKRKKSSKHDEPSEPEESESEEEAQDSESEGRRSTAVGKRFLALFEIKSKDDVPIIKEELKRMKKRGIQVEIYKTMH